MSKYFISFNNKNSDELNLYVVKRPNIPSPKRRYEEVEIDGRNGKLYRDKGTYEEIEISIDFNFCVVSPEEWNMKLREIKKWINNIENKKLKLSDDLSYFYKVNKVVLSDVERVLRRIGKFKLTFTCDPFMYLDIGLEEKWKPLYLFNNYEVSYPTYIIKGEGTLTINLNGKKAIFNIGGNLIINTELQLCYRNDGTMKNSSMTGKYKDLILQKGDNNFTFTDGFDIRIIPNWRCL